MRESKGFAIAVSDEKISAALNDVAREEGLLLCPEGAATEHREPVSTQQGSVPGQGRRALVDRRRIAGRT